MFVLVQPRRDVRHRRQHQHRPGLEQAGQADAQGALQPARLRHLIVADLARPREAFGHAGPQRRAVAFDERPVAQPGLASLQVPKRPEQGIGIGIDRHPHITRGTEHGLNEIDGRRQRLANRPIEPLEGIGCAPQRRVLRQRSGIGSQQHVADPLEHRAIAGEIADGIEARAQRHATVQADPRVRGPQAEQPAMAGRHPRRAAGVGTQRKIAQPRGNRGRRPR